MSVQRRAIAMYIAPRWSMVSPRHGSCLVQTYETSRISKSEASHPIGDRSIMSALLALTAELHVFDLRWCLSVVNFVHDAAMSIRKLEQDPVGSFLDWVNVRTCRQRKFVALSKHWEGTIQMSITGTSVMSWI